MKKLSLKRRVLVGIGIFCLSLGAWARPLVIGLSDSYEPSFEGLVHEWPTMSGTALSYVDAIGKAGHVPIVLCRTTDTNTLERILGTIDLLVLTGGNDVDPKLYGEPNRKCGELIPERDRFDWALMDIAVRKRLPVLGICRGAQFINVYFGGSLCQDIRSEWEPKTKLSHGMGLRAYAHTIDIEPDSRLARLLKQTKDVRVNSAHHQCVKRPGKGLRIVARAPDGVVEGIEHETLPIAALQFHPESSVSLLNDLLQLKIYQDPLALVGAEGAK